MITRDVAQIRPVLGVRHQRYDASCGGNDGTTGNETLGPIIDRLGLGRQYNSALLHAFGAELRCQVVNPKPRSRRQLADVVAVEHPVSQVSLDPGRRPLEVFIVCRPDPCRQLGSVFFSLIHVRLPC